MLEASSTRSARPHPVQPFPQSSLCNDTTAVEDILRDLITETSEKDTEASYRGVKRSRDNESADEPLAKRDKLSEELELMSTYHLSPLYISPEPVPVLKGNNELVSRAERGHSRPGNTLPIRNRVSQSQRVQTTQSIPRYNSAGSKMNNGKAEGND